MDVGTITVPGWQPSAGYVAPSITQPRSILKLPQTSTNSAGAPLLPCTLSPVLQRTAAVLADTHGAAVLQQSCHLQRAANPNAPLLRALVKLLAAGRVAVAVDACNKGSSSGNDQEAYDAVLHVSLLDAAFSDNAPALMHVTSDHDVKTLMLALGVDSLLLDNATLPDDTMRATLFDIMLPPPGAPVAPEPQGLLSTLFDYQRQALHWMLACERRSCHEPKSDGAHCLFEVKQVPGGTLWYNRYNGACDVVDVDDDGG